MFKAQEVRITWELWKIRDILTNLSLGTNRVHDDSRINSARVDTYGLQSNVGNQPLKISQMKKKLWTIIEPTKEEVQVRLNLDTSTNVILSTHNN